MKNVMILLAVFAVTGIASAEMLNNPETFDQYADGTVLWDGGGPVDGWEGWGASGEPWVGGNDWNVVNGGAVDSVPTAGSWGYNLLFNHDNELASLPGAPAPGDIFELRFDILSITGDAIVKIEFYDSDARDGQNVALNEDPITLTPGTQSFTVEIPADKYYVTPVIGCTGGGDAAVRLDNIWIGKEGSFAAGKATDPDPKNDAVVGKDAVTALSWINPDPNDPLDPVTSDVYFLDAGATELTEDPNMGPDNNDSGSTQIAFDTTDETVAAPTLADNTHYYWAVHCTDPTADPNGNPVTTQGDIWHFYTGDALPVVTAGPDQYMWLAQDDSALDGGENDPNVLWFEVISTYEDDGKSDIVNVNIVTDDWGWDPNSGEFGAEKVSQVHTPNPDGPNGEHSGTVTAVYKTYTFGDDLDYPTDATAIPGWWNIRLEVTDASGTGTGTSFHRIDADCGSAADVDPLDDFDRTYDVNNDCINNLIDFAAFAEKWLDFSDKYE